MRHEFISRWRLKAAQLPFVSVANEDFDIDRPHLMYTVSTAQNPSSASVTPERAAAVYAVAQKHDLVRSIPLEIQNLIAFQLTKFHIRHNR